MHDKIQTKLFSKGSQSEPHSKYSFYLYLSNQIIQIQAYKSHFANQDALARCQPSQPNKNESKECISQVQSIILTNIKPIKIKITYIASTDTERI